MFYISECAEPGKLYGVKDTKDGVVEYYTPEQIVKVCLGSSVFIHGVSMAEDDILLKVVDSEYISTLDKLKSYVRTSLCSSGSGDYKVPLHLCTGKYTLGRRLVLLSDGIGFAFLCEINGKVNLYSSSFDDFFDLHVGIRDLSKVDTLWVSGVPLDNPNEKYVRRYKILSGTSRLDVEVTFGTVSFRDSDGFSCRHIRY